MPADDTQPQPKSTEYLNDGANKKLQALRNKGDNSKVRKLSPDDRRSIWELFDGHGRSAPSIARLLKCKPTQVEEVIREEVRRRASRAARNVQLLGGAA